MSTAELIPTSYDNAARTLARWHAGGGDSRLEAYLIPDPDQRVVRLVEVSDAFPASGRVAPVTFGASAEFPYRSSVVLLSPDEWQELLQGRLALPEGWQLESRQRLLP